MDTRPNGPAHVLILAGGEGARTRAVTRAFSGDDRPKQFSTLVGREPLLVQTQRRAALVVPPSRTLTILTRQHEPYYRDMVSGLEPSTLVVQPESRGTAAAVLYGLLRVAVQSPDSPVVILPSDHWVSSDADFMVHVAAAVGFVRAYENMVVLLGVAATRPEPEYGWIEPSDLILGAWSALHRVRRFVEKPTPELALGMHRAGTHFWNTSVVAGHVEALLFLFAMSHPELVDAFLEAWTALATPSEDDAIERVYAGLPSFDFSRDILAAQPGSLAVLEVSGVAWEDIGHPSRILAARRRDPMPTRPQVDHPARRSHIA